ncbi:MAG TPA: tetratricopeptide repeat-containing sensor histidine kinase [Chryseosolibacter sp.]
MSAKRGLLAGIFLFTTHFFAFGQTDSELAHFQEFFSGKPSISTEKALHENAQQLEQAREINDVREIARLLRDLGLINLNRLHNYETAMDLFTESLAISDSLALESGQLLAFVAIARVFEVVGDYPKSAQFLEQALELDKEQRSINSVAMILNSLGKVNASRGHLEDALNNYQQVLRYKIDIDKPYEAEALFNLGHLYTLMGKYADALEAHKKALAVSRTLKDRHSEALSLNDIGVLYGKMKNEDKSLANHLVALEIWQELDDKRGMAESYNNLGWHYFHQQQQDKAISSGLLALEHGRESQAQDQIFKSYDLLSQANKELGDYKNSLMYKELSLLIHEFIQSEKQERQLLETQNRYVVGKKETEIQRLEALRVEREKELAAQKKFRNTLFILVALVMVIAGLLFILYLVKRRANRILRAAKKEVQQHNEKLQELNYTKDKFFSIISHDLKGPLNSLTSFSHLLIDHTDKMSKEEIQLLAKDLDKSVKNLLTLLENLLEWSRSQTGSIDFSGEVFDLQELLENNKNLLGPQARNKQISIELDPSEACFVKLHKQSINTVIRNLIANAIKFTPEGGAIRAAIKREGNRLNVVVSDNGVGMTNDVVENLFRLDSKHSTRGTANEKGTGLGLILCREYVEKNGGKISVQSTVGKGSVFAFSFPLAVCATPTVRKISENVSF